MNAATTTDKNGSPCSASRAQLYTNPDGTIVWTYRGYELHRTDNGWSARADAFEPTSATSRTLSGVQTAVDGLIGG